MRVSTPPRDGLTCTDHLLVPLLSPRFVPLLAASQSQPGELVMPSSTPELSCPLVPGFVPTSPPVLPLTPRSRQSDNQSSATVTKHYPLRGAIWFDMNRCTRVTCESCATGNCQPEINKHGSRTQTSVSTQKPTETEYTLRTTAGTFDPHTSLTRR